MSIVSFLLLLFVFSAHAAKKQVYTTFIKEEEVVKTLKYPAQIKSEVYSEVRALSNSVVMNFDAFLGQKVKKNDKLITLKNQDRSLNFRPQTLKSFTNGVVSKLFVDVGSYISRGDKLMLITDPNKLQIRFEIPVRDNKFLKLNQEAKVTIAGLDKVFKAKITGIGQVADSVTSTITVRAIFSNLVNNSIPSNLLSEVQIDFKQGNKLLVNKKAITYIGQVPYIRTIKEGRVHKNKVQLSDLIKDRVIIDSGLSIGDEVVIRSNNYLIDGDEVEVVKK